MSRRSKTTTIVCLFLVLLIAALVATPLPIRLLLPFLRRTVAAKTGLLLEMGSVQGSLVGGLTLNEIRIGEPDGVRIAEVGVVEAGADIGVLLRERRVDADLRLEGARLLLETGPGGSLVGWSRLVEEPDTAAVPSEPFRLPESIRLDVEVVDLDVAVRDTARGLIVDVTDVSLSASGAGAEFESEVRGSFSAALADWAIPLTGRFNVALAGDDSKMELASAEISTDAGDVSASGVMSFGGSGRDATAGAARGESARIVARVECAIDLARAAAIGGVSDIEGRLGIVSEIRGEVGALAYGVDVTGRDLVLAGTGVASLDATISGDERVLSVERLRVRSLGGIVDASGTVDLAALAGGAEAAAAPAFNLRAVIDGVRLSEILTEERGVAADVTGSVSGTVGVGASGSAPADVAADFDVVASALSVGGREVGDLGVVGRLGEGIVTASGTLGPTTFTARAEVADDGVHDIAFSTFIPDLSAHEAALGVTGLAGSGDVRGTFGSVQDTLTVDLVASFPDLRAGGAQVGPVTVDVSGRRNALAARFSAFDAALSGAGTLTDGARYEARVRADGLEFGLVVGDTLRDVVDVDVALTADVAATGAIGESYLVAGDVTGLAVSAEEHEMSLAAPFRFSATPESVRCSRASLRGTLGRLSVGGTYRFDGSGGHLAATFNDIDLAGVADLVPGGSPMTLEGILNGRLSLSADGKVPVLLAEVAVTDLFVNDASLPLITVEAESDSSELAFEVTATSATSGTVAAYGTVPIVSDSLRWMVLDGSREFGATVVCSDFVLEAGSGFLDHLRGEKRVEIDGSFLLSGSVDSLSSLNGRGRFDGITATLGAVDVSLASPLDIEVRRGDIELSEVGIAVARRRVLGPERGGEINVSGSIRRDGSLDLAAKTDDLDVGHLLGALAPRGAPPTGGSLDLTASVRGSVAEPVVEFAWDVDAPVIYGVGFSRLSGGAVFGEGALRLRDVQLVARGDVILVSGVIPVPAAVRQADDGREGEAVREFDLKLASSGFRLGRLTSLPPGIGKIDGVLSMDAHVFGPLGSPDIDGTLALEQCTIRAPGLREPVRDLGFEIVAGDRAVALKNGRAALGRGRIDLSAFVQLDAPGGAMFWLRAKLRSPEVKLKDMLEGRFKGEVLWAGTASSSVLSADVVIEKLEVTYEVGLGDLLERRPVRVVMLDPADPRENVSLALDIEIADKVDVKNDLVNIDLAGGVYVGGTLLSPAFSGGLYGTEGSFRYLGNKFTLETLNVQFIDPRRRDPYIDLVGTGEVLSRSGEQYLVTVRFRGFALEGVPELTSDPPLSEPDIVALLTFGDTVGAMVSGGAQIGTSGESFDALAREAFTDRLFGIAETTMARALHLDTVVLGREGLEGGELSVSDVTLGKEFGERVTVNYTTGGRFGRQRVEVSFKLTDRISIGTRTDYPESNHAADLTVHLRFK